MHYLRGIYHKTTVKISKLAGIESLHLKRKGILFPSDLKQKHVYMHSRDMGNYDGTNSCFAGTSL